MYEVVLIHPLPPVDRGWVHSVFVEHVVLSSTGFLIAEVGGEHVLIPPSNIKYIKECGSIL